MNVLFIHKIFPGQFTHLIRAFAETAGMSVVALCQDFAAEVHAESYPGCKVMRYAAPASGPSGLSPAIQRFTFDVGNGEAVARTLLDLKDQGYCPDVIIAHMGWGEALFCKDVYPQVPLLAYCEFFYHSSGVDVDFEPDSSPAILERFRIRCLNASQLVQLVSADAGITPTQWQRGLYPAELRGKISVIHEGVDTVRFSPNRLAEFTLPDGTALHRDAEVVTYASRSLEPYRGFHQFMRAVEILHRKRPHAQVLVAGDDGVSYNRPLASGKSYREKLCAEVDIDPSRIHFLGWLPHKAYRRLLQVSSAHVYLTAPFVLSWSLIEAMSSACVVVASDTEPVREVIRHGENGLLCDFFAPEHIADAIGDVLDHPVRMQHLGAQARRDVLEKFDKERQVRHYASLIGKLTDPRFGELRVNL